MIEFFLPNSRALLPTFRTNCPDGSHFAQMGSNFAQNTTTNPCSLLSVTIAFRWYAQTRNTPSPTPKHPFSWPDFESGKMNYCLGKLDPIWAKCLKSGQNFSRSAQFFLFIFIYMNEYTNEFIWLLYEFIHEMNVWIHLWNEYEFDFIIMNS